VSTASSRTRIQKGFLSLAVLAVLAFTLATVVFSGASFTTGSANPASVFTAGTLLHTNDRAGQITVNAAGLLPGKSQAGTIRLTNAGTVPGRFTLSAAGLSDVPSFPRLSDALTLTVTDTGGATLYDGPVSAFTSADLGTLVPAGTRTIGITIAFPDGAMDIGLQGAATSLSLRITGVSS
jgi:hypothetical protein